MNEKPFKLAEPFDIDDGSLKGKTPEYAFVLGVEWAKFRALLSTGRPFVSKCLPENRIRFVKMAESHGRFVEDRHIACVGWWEIWVGDLIASAPPMSDSK
jgi:hypothetical protein